MDLLKEIAEPSRRSILNELKSGPKNVSDLVGLTGMKQPNVSNHLSKLRMRGIVRANKVGRQVFYSLSNAEVEAALHGLLNKPEETEAPPITFDEAAKRYARAACAGDEATCARMIDSLIRHGAPLVRIYQQVLAESMNLVGRWYEVQAIDEGQEHLASAITERMMARVLHFSGPTRRTARKAILGCVSGNWHSIGLRMISDFLKLSGWKTLYLGASVPTNSFLSAINEHRPDLVLISCMHEGTLDDCLDLIRQMVGSRSNPRQFLIGVGGGMVSENPKPFMEAGADFVAPSLMVFSEEILPRIESGDPSSSFGVFTNHKKLD